MPTLENEHYELFAQSLAQGKTAQQAYSDAGYKPSRKNAWRLKTNKDIMERVAELQCNAARGTEVSIQSILAELDDAIAVARGKGQAQAMVSASSMKAKLAGLMIERTRIEVSQADDEGVPHFWIESDFPRAIGLLLDQARERYPALVEWTDCMAAVIAEFFPTFTPGWRLHRTPRRRQRVIDAVPERVGISQYESERG